MRKLKLNDEDKPEILRLTVEIRNVFPIKRSPVENEADSLGASFRFEGTSMESELRFPAGTDIKPGDVVEITTTRCKRPPIVQQSRQRQVRLSAEEPFAAITTPNGRGGQDVEHLRSGTCLRVEGDGGNACVVILLRADAGGSAFTGRMQSGSESHFRFGAILSTVSPDTFAPVGATVVYVESRNVLGEQSESVAEVMEYRVSGSGEVSVILGSGSRTTQVPMTTIRRVGMGGPAGARSLLDAMLSWETPNLAEGLPAIGEQLSPQFRGTTTGRFSAITATEFHMKFLFGGVSVRSTDMHGTARVLPSFLFAYKSSGTPRRFPALENIDFIHVQWDGLAWALVKDDGAIPPEHKLRLWEAFLESEVSAYAWLRVHGVGEVQATQRDLLTPFVNAVVNRVDAHVHDSTVISQIYQLRYDPRVMNNLLAEL